MTVIDLISLEQSLIEHARRVVDVLPGHAVPRRAGHPATEQNLADGWLRWVTSNAGFLDGMDEQDVSRLYLLYRERFFKGIGGHGGSTSIYHNPAEA